MALEIRIDRAKNAPRTSGGGGVIIEVHSCTCIQGPQCFGKCFPPSSNIKSSKDSEIINGIFSILVYACKRFRKKKKPHFGTSIGFMHEAHARFRRPKKQFFYFPIQYELYLPIARIFPIFETPEENRKRWKRGKQGKQWRRQGNTGRKHSILKNQKKGVFGRRFLQTCTPLLAVAL